MNTPGHNFQLREQLILYCLVFTNIIEYILTGMNDVAILRESVLRFRALVAELTNGLDPFRVASTAAGLAMATMRRCFLPANTLVQSPEGGYLRGRRASLESRRYIRLFELMHPEARGQVQCADWSIGEAHVEDTGYRLDGLWHRPAPEPPMAIEYMGCFYHGMSERESTYKVHINIGCPVCFPNREQPLAAGRPAEQLYEQTQRRLWVLEHERGFHLHVMWGCELRAMLRRNAEARRLWQEQCVPGILGPLDPREHALRGGRTEPFCLQHKCTEEEEIVCIDIVGLMIILMVIIHCIGLPLSIRNEGTPISGWQPRGVHP